MTDRASLGQFAGMRRAARLVSLAVVVTGLATLPRYGLTADEALGNMFFGERYFNYFLTFDRAYLDFGNHDLPIHQRAPDLFRSPWRVSPWAFPPLADTLCAATMEVLGHRLRWLDPVDAFHAGTILLVGLLLVCLYDFAAPRVGSVPALVGVAILGTYPRFWGDMHNNVKDVPQTVFFSLTLMAAAGWYRSPSLTRAIGAGILGGAALAVKVNSVFVPIVLILGLCPWERSRRPWKPAVRYLARYWWHWVLALGAAAATFVAVWPWLWLPHRTARRLGLHVNAFMAQGGHPGPQGWNPDPIVQTISTMPEIVLVFVLIGTGVLLADITRGRDSSGTGRLLLVWMAVPVLRASLPGMANFDGIRHFLEFLPAAALIAGVGLARTVAVAPRYWRVPVGAALSFALVSNVGAALVRYHPFQMIYFNHLVGGLEGASRDYGFQEATDYWAGSYRQGMDWLNRHAEKGALVYVSVFPWIADVSSPLWLRPDLRIADSGEATLARTQGKPLYVMYVTRPRYFDTFAKECFGVVEPAYRIMVDRVPVLEICRTP